MPIIKSAIKKVRKDKKRTLRNMQKKEALKKLIRQVRKSFSQNSLQKVSSALDKAAKTRLIHPNKASRLKSKLARLQGKPKTTASKTHPLKK